MKKVLVTRPANQAEEFSEVLSRHGLEPVYFPVIEIGPAADWSATDSALQHIDEYDALVFTSANGVRYFIERMSRAGRNCDEMPAAFGLGKKTKIAIADCGLTVVPTEDALNASGLAGEICTFMSTAGFNGIEDMRLLFPCGDQVRNELSDALRAHRAIVEIIVVYTNHAVIPVSTPDVIAQFKRQKISCVSFFSPSQVEVFLSIIPQFTKSFRTDVLVAAIGETTADALRTAGIIPDCVASVPDGDLFADEIARMLGIGIP